MNGSEGSSRVTVLAEIPDDCHVVAGPAVGTAIAWILLNWKILRLFWSRVLRVRTEDSVSNPLGVSLDARILLDVS
jgi:hypothetical protein